MQPANSMVPQPMAAPSQQQYQQQPQQHWMAQQQPAAYQVPQQQSAYYYQQQQQPQYNAAAAAAQPTSSDEIRSLWIGDLQFWMDEQYIQNCFAHTGEVRFEFRIWIIDICFVFFKFSSLCILKLVGRKSHWCWYLDMFVCGCCTFAFWTMRRQLKRLVIFNFQNLFFSFHVLWMYFVLVF